MTTLPQIGLLLGVVALSACNRQNDRTASEPAQPNSEPVVERDRDLERRDVDRDEATGMVPASRALPAAQSIAEARCARERTCENIGADKKYSSMADCMTRVQNDWREDLNARECPGGVDQKELNECLGEIRNEDCNNPFDTLGRVAACTAAQICVEDARDVAE